MTATNKIIDLSNLTPILIESATQANSKASQPIKPLKPFSKAQRRAAIKSPAIAQKLREAEQFKNTASSIQKAITPPDAQENPIDPKSAESRIISIAATSINAVALCSYFIAAGLSTCSIAKLGEISDSLSSNCIKAFESDSLYSLHLNDSLIVCKRLNFPISKSFFETPLQASICQTDLGAVFEPLSATLRTITGLKFVESASITAAGYYLPDRLLRHVGLEGTFTKDMLRTLISCGSSTVCGYLSGLGIVYPLFSAGCTKITELVIDLIT